MHALRYINRYLLFFVLLDVFCTAPLRSYENIVDKVSEYNRQSLLPLEKEDRSHKTHYNYLQHLQRCIQNQRTLIPAKKRGIAYEILSRNAQHMLPPTMHVTDQITWSDLQLFRGKNIPQVYLGQIIDRTMTEMGRVVLYSYLADPLTDNTELFRRQDLIKELVGNQELFEQIENILRKFRDIEDLLLSCWTEDEFKQLSQSSYLNLPLPRNWNNALNNSNSMLLCNHIYDYYGYSALFLLTLGAVGILPIYGMSQLGYHHYPWITKIGKRLIGTGSSAFGFMSLSANPVIRFEAAILSALVSGMLTKRYGEQIYNTCTLDTLLHEKMLAVATGFSVIKSIKSILQKHIFFRKTRGYQALHTLMQLMSDNTSPMYELNTLLSSKTFQGTPTLFHHYGKVLRAFALIHEHKAMIESALCAIGEIDALMSVARLLKEYKNSSASYCFVDFDFESRNPTICFDNMWNPFIDNAIVVTNTVKLGATHMVPHMVVTGPNAGGKSTITTSIPINLILAQSFGIAAASHAIITPFKKILTYLNITDDIVLGDSLFKSQLKRVKTLSECINALSDNEYGFFLFDEMFNGTDPQIGQVLSYSVAQDIGKHTHVVSVLSTHFPLLTTLEKQGNFKNYHVSAYIDANGRVQYTFRLEPGISRQNIAFNIMQQEGFKPAILEKAKELLKIR